MSDVPATRLDVLVVDDNEDLLDLSTRALKRAGFTVGGVKSYEELATSLAAGEPKLILMDVQMPELFGDEVAAILRDVRGVRAKIVLYSSLDPEVLDSLAKSAGVDGAISKTAGLGELVAGIRKLLA